MLPGMGVAEQLVVIGASAGGLEALDFVFEGAPPDPRVAYVVILHLSPNHESTLPTRIARHTTMNVVGSEERGGRFPRAPVNGCR